MSHFPRKEWREPGSSEAQNRAAFTGPLAEAPLLGSKQAQEEREQTQQEGGKGLKMKPGALPLRLGAFVAGWGGRPGMNYPLHQLQGFRLGG